MPIRRMSRLVASGLVGATLIFALMEVPGCSRSDQRVVVLYASADEQVVNKVIAAFEQASGIHVLVVGDTEAKKTTGLVERLIAEKDHPQADVFWSSEVFMTIDLARRGVLDPYLSESVTDWPATCRDSERRWYGFAARARVIAFSPSRVPADQVPRSWMDLTRDVFKDRLVLADPRFGTTGGHLGAMKAYWDRQVMPGYYEAYLEGLAANHARMLPSGNAGVVDAIVHGEADVGMTDTDDVWAAQEQGLDVQLVYPTHSVVPGEKGVGTLLIPNTVAIVKNGPHGAAAKRLMEYLLSPEVERMLAESTSHNISLRVGSMKADDKYAVPDPLRIDYSTAAAARDDAVGKAVRMLGARGGNSVPAHTAPASTNPAATEPHAP